MMKTKPICHPKKNHVLSFFIFLCIMFAHHYEMAQAMGQNTADTVDYEEFKVGVVLDFDNVVSKIALTSMSLALSDLHSATDDTHKTKLVLHTRDSHRDLADAASQANDLLEKVGVQTIIGPLTSLQAIIVADLGNKAQVPVMSFTATSPMVSPSQNPYFIRTTQSDLAQVNVIVELVKTFGWREVVPIYEDTVYGMGRREKHFSPFHAIDTKVPYRSAISPTATDGDILKALYKLMSMQTRVFVVHMTPSLGIRVFQKAKMIGMMSKGYSWIITDGLANILGSFNSSVIDSMQGVLAVRPYIPKSIELDEFHARWKKKFIQENPDIENFELNIFGVRAYDTIWALASILEKMDRVNSSRLLKPPAVNDSAAMTTSGAVQMGSKLLQLISETNFFGRSGEFNLINRELRPTAFQLLNVIGNTAREIGIWTTSNGILSDSSSLITTRAKDLSTAKDNLRAIIWPGESTVVPKGWVIPEAGKKLRIGVPVKRGFTDFVKVTTNSSFNNSTYVTGYCIDLFKAVIEMLPYPVTYEFVPFAKADGTTAGTYDDLVYQVYAEKFDAVVGDVTITANRSMYVDFTLPYTRNNHASILLKPLNKKLWLMSAFIFLVTGTVIWMLEREENPLLQGRYLHQLGTIFWFLFSTPAFADQEKVRHGMARVVVITWVFLLLILSSSYTASLTSMLTVHRLEPTVTDVHELIKNRQNVGYLEGTFVYTMLRRMGFEEANLKPYVSTEDFKDAFTGLRNKEDRIVAAFDEAPYNRLLLSKYCHKYALVGPTHKTEGFGFAFPRGSPLVPDVSRAILNLREDDKNTRIEQAWFGSQNGCSDPDAKVYETSLTYDSFQGLFLIAAIPLAIAVLVYIVEKLIELWEGDQESNDNIEERTMSVPYSDSEYTPNKGESSAQLNQVEPREIEEPDLGDKGAVNELLIGSNNYKGKNKLSS
ncbi:hypothetical protein MKW92_009596 [Papaver armeniacum]|nr:hypothetical protein MKW92_009596 [Papaver armeniacum]